MRISCKRLTRRFYIYVCHFNRGNGSFGLSFRVKIFIGTIDRCSCFHIVIRTSKLYVHWHLQLIVIPTGWYHPICLDGFNSVLNVTFEIISWSENRLLLSNSKTHILLIPVRRNVDFYSRVTFYYVHTTSVIFQKLNKNIYWRSFQIYEKFIWYKGIRFDGFLIISKNCITLSLYLKINFVSLLSLFPFRSRFFFGKPASFFTRQ